jgi:hypothetical protein
VTGRAARSGRVPGGDPSSDGPGVAMTSSFEARSDLVDGVVDAEGAAAPFQRQDPSLQDQIVL